MGEQAWTIWLMRDDPDEGLVRAMAAGDRQALDALYARHGPAMLAYLVGQVGQRALAEEVLQDVMLAAWEGAVRFRGESQVRTWLLGIARHRAANARRRLSSLPLPLDERFVADAPKLSDVVEQQDERGLVRQSLSNLPEAQRETLELVFFHELSEAEVAQVTGVALGTVKSRLHRAKAALKQMLGRAGADQAR